MKNILKDKVFLKNIPMLLLMAFAVILVVTFIEEYCNTFSKLGFMAKERLINQPVFAFFITPAFFWISAYLCRKFASNASGNSIDHLKEALVISEKNPDNFGKISNILGIRVIMVKTVSSLLCSFGGGALGREGPAVHMSAGIFAVIGYKFKAFLPRLNIETWILAGAATGMAIAFHAPISGFVFASEKLLKLKNYNFRNNVAWIIIVTLMLVGMLYHYDTIFIVADLNFMLFVHSFLLLTTAVICGLLAFAFKATNRHLYKKIVAIKSNLWHLVPIVCGFAVAGISVYSGIHSFSGGIYTTDEALVSAELLLTQKDVFGRIANTMISFISGCAGGLVAPAITIGAGIGSITSTLMPGVDPNIFLLIGMAAFLGAVLGEPITAAIIVFEITAQSIGNLPFLLGSSIISFVAFKLFEKLINFWASHRSKSNPSEA